MTDNPYMPPKADVVDVPLTTSQEESAIFFPTSVLKLIVLWLCTFSLYQLYWFYQNWNMYRNRTGSDISPAARSIFAVFYCYSLCGLMSDKAEKSGTRSFPAGLTATAWIILTLLSRLPDPYWLISLTSVFALVPAQRTVNAINRELAPNHNANSRFSAWNWLAVILGVPFALLVVVGTFLPEA